MKKLILLSLIPLIAWGQDVTRNWSDTDLTVRNVTVNGTISGFAELEFESVAQMLAFDFSQTSDGSRIKCNGYNVANDEQFGPDVFWDATSTGTADGLLIFDPTIAGNGRLIRTFTDTINVKWAGAIGDGTLDDAPEINAALATGNSIYIPEGDFLIGSTLEIISSGQKIVGAGGAKTKLWKNANNLMVLIPSDHSRAGISGCWLIGSHDGYGQSQYDITAWTAIPAARASFTDTTDLLRIGDDPGVTLGPTDVVVEDCRIYSGGRDGVNHVEGPRLTFRNVSIYYNARWGFWSDYQSNVQGSGSATDTNHATFDTTEILHNGLGNYTEGGNMSIGGGSQFGANLKIMRGWGEGIRNKSRKSTYFIHEELNGRSNTQITSWASTTAYTLGDMRRADAERMEISGITGTFVAGETVTGGTSSETAVIEVVHSDSLIIRARSGTLTGSETITGGTSSATATYDSITTLSDYRIYFCTVGGTSGSTAPDHVTGTASDGTVTWQYRSGSPFYGEDLTDKDVRIFWFTNNGDKDFENAAVPYDNGYYFENASTGQNNNFSQNSLVSSGIKISRQAQRSQSQYNVSSSDSFKNLEIRPSATVMNDFEWGVSSGSSVVYRLLLDDSYDTNFMQFTGGPNNRFWFSSLVNGYKPSSLQSSNWSNFSRNIGETNMVPFDVSSGNLIADLYNNTLITNGAASDDDAVGLKIVFQRVNGTNQLRIRTTDGASPPDKKILSIDGSTLYTSGASSGLDLNSGNSITLVELMYVGSSNQLGYDTIDSAIRWVEIRRE